MTQHVIKKIELEKFSNRVGLEMGLEVVNLAKERNQSVAVQVDRLNYTIFTYIDDNLCADKHHWLKRKSQLSKHFEESSLSIKNDLIGGGMSLKKTFALDEKKYLAKGGSIPIFVNNSGMVATITVSGLSDEEDHQLIIDALKGKFTK